MSSPLVRLDANLLVALDALLDERHVTRAARRLNITQPAASHALSRARELLDDPLLVRRGNRLERTPRAEALAGPLREALQQLEGVVSGRVAFHPATDRRTFRLAVTDYVGTLLLPTIVARVAADAPGVSLVAHAADPTTYAGELDRGDLDLAVSPLPYAVGIAQEDLFEEAFAVLARRGHPVLDGPWDTAAWCAWPHVVMSASRGDGPGVVDTALAELGLRRRVALRIPSFAVGPEVVGATDLLMALPRRLAVRYAERFGLALLELPLALEPFPVVMAWARRRERDPALGWLRDAVRDAAATAR